MKKIANHVIPETGISGNLILDQIRDFQKGDVNWEDGRTWSLVYHADKAHDQLLQDVSNQFFSANYLNPLAFQSLKKMENEVIEMTSDMLNGGEQTVGAISSGGTESILLAIYTYREWAKKNYPAIKAPEIVAPETIHPAFNKAAHLFGLKIRKAKVDREKCAMVDELEKSINQNTILIAASAPSYPHGVLDPIPEIGALAEKYQLPFHVDACIGGFMLPWVERLGEPLVPFDFRVPAVTSISADVHKFGYGAKGASVILYQKMDFLKYQFYITTDWSGGIYASPTLLGSRAGGPIASAWASMKHMGVKGYLSIAKSLVEGRKKLEEKMKDIPELQIVGKPCMNIMAYTTRKNKPDIFAVADQLEKRGWMLDRQQSPGCIHLTVLPTNVSVIDQYISDIKASIDYVKTHPETSGSGNAAIYGMSARIPFRGMVKNNVRQMFIDMYSRGGETNDFLKPDQSKSIAHVPKWMGFLSRFLSFWKKISGRN